jgi:hypothetical protein
MCSASSYFLAHPTDSNTQIRTLFVYNHLMEIIKPVTEIKQSRRCPWVPGALSPGLKRQGREVDHSAPTSADVKKMWI